MLGLVRIQHIYYIYINIHVLWDTYMSGSGLSVWYYTCIIELCDANKTLGWVWNILYCTYDANKAPSWVWYVHMLMHCVRPSMLYSTVLSSTDKAQGCVGLSLHHWQWTPRCTENTTAVRNSNNKKNNHMAAAMCDHSLVYTVMCTAVGCQLATTCSSKWTQGRN